MKHNFTTSSSSGHRTFNPTEFSWLVTGSFVRTIHFNPRIIKCAELTDGSTDGLVREGEFSTWIVPNGITSEF